MILGNAAMMKRDLASAAKWYRELVAAEPDNPVGYFRMGLLSRARQDNAAALDYFDRAAAMDPSMLDATRQGVLILGSEKRYDEALERCRSQMKRVGEDKKARAVLTALTGDLLLAQGKGAEAEAAYEDALALDPDNMGPYFALARMHLRSGNAEKAIRQYQAALAQNPRQPGIHTILGTIYDQQDQPEQAETHYREALKIDPEFAPAANNLAYLLANSDRELDEALTYARLAKAKYPDDPGVMDTLGLVYLKKGLIDSAVAELKESAAKLGENPTVRYHLALAYHLQGKPDLARQELQAALDLDKAFPEKKAAQQLLAGL